MLDTWTEFDDGVTHCIQTIFPTLVVQLTLNSLAVRFFTPRGLDRTELFWIYLGYQDDNEQQTRQRLMQSNLTGAAGLVSLEDGCINEFVQRGTRGSEDRNASSRWAAAMSRRRMGRARPRPASVGSGKAIAN